VRVVHSLKLDSLIGAVEVGVGNELLDGCKKEGKSVRLRRGSRGEVEHVDEPSRTCAEGKSQYSSLSRVRGREAETHLLEEFGLFKAGFLRARETGQ
jgi:hypothetical protein